MGPRLAPHTVTVPDCDDRTLKAGLLMSIHHEFAIEDGNGVSANRSPASTRPTAAFATSGLRPVLRAR